MRHALHTCFSGSFAPVAATFSSKSFSLHQEHRHRVVKKNVHNHVGKVYNVHEKYAKIPLLVPVLFSDLLLQFLSVALSSSL